MPPRALPCLLVLAALPIGACGSASSSGTVRAWKVEDPYLPPPDPSTLAKAKTDAPAAEAEPTSTPTVARGDDAPAMGAPSDAQIAAELREAYGGKGGTNLDQAAIDANGLAIVPDTAPRKLVALMHAANDVAKKPYVYGGGHGRVAGEIWTDSAYDCSGSVSYALAAAGYLRAPRPPAR